MRGSLGLIACLLAGCGNLFGLEVVSNRDAGGGDDDAPGDDGDAGDGSVGANCFGKFQEICVDDDVLLPWTPMTPINTGGTGNDCDVVLVSGGREVCVIASDTIAITTPIAARGGRPLVLIGATAVTINAMGELDVNSLETGQKGAGGNPSDGCVDGTPGGVSPMGAGGGAGGTFITIGGAGGTGNVGTIGGGAPNVDDQLAPTTLRGGCDGSNGGGGTRGGDGGGAVYVISGGQIVIGGVINASGGGGSGGGFATLGGGGGGGTGGMIVLDAPMITIATSAFVFAVGAAGGGGVGTTVTGGPGGEPTTMSPNLSSTPGSGGASGGGFGGAGSNKTTATGSAGGNGVQAGTSGGGGGGGWGSIRIRATTMINQGTVVPAAN